MSQHTINLLAGVNTRIETKGRFFMLRSVSGGATLDVHIEVRGDGLSNDEFFEGVEGGFKARISSGRFDSVNVKASAGCSVVYVISDNDVDFDFFAGASVNATIVAPNPLPVSNDRGSPGNLLHVTGVSLADAPAVAASSNAPVAAGPVAVVVAAADANRRAIRFCNLGASDVAIGPAGLTWAQRVIVLKTGDVWIEDRGANLAWSAITDAGGAASVTWQGITA